MYKYLGVILLIFNTTANFATAGPTPNFYFNSIDGEIIQLEDLTGKVVLVVNTASRCGFTSQYDGLQKLYNQYANKGLEIIAVPSNDFRQELDSNKKIKNFCETNFGISFLVSEATKILGRDAHPFYRWLKKEYNYQPSWNFNKIIIDSSGKISKTFSALVKPNSPKITGVIETLLEKK